MTDLTVEQALHKGIAAHKIGKLQEAERLYTAVIKNQPKHPDANHNMGVLAVGANKPHEALSFFKTALEAKPATAQFWISYIDTMIKLERFADAKAVLDQAKSKGGKGDGFDKLEQRLSETHQKPLLIKKITATTHPEHQSILDTLKLDQAIKQAERKTNEGSTEEAKSIYRDILTKFPNNKRASDGLKVLAGEGSGETRNSQNPPSSKIQSLVNIFNQRRFQEVLQLTEACLQEFPKSHKLYYLYGLVCKELSQLESAADAFQKAILLNPNDPQAHFMMGLVLQKVKKPEQAIDAYKKAILIKKDYVEAICNLSNMLRQKGDLKEAIKTLRNAIILQPKQPELHYNLGIILKKSGSLDAAIKCYQTALNLKPNYVEAMNNLGIALMDNGQIKEAEYQYKLALKTDPSFAPPAWNLIGVADNAEEAEVWAEHCLRLDPRNLDAKLAIVGLKFYRGQRTEFNEFLNSPLKKNPVMRSYEWVFNLPKLPNIYFNRWHFFDAMVEESEKSRPFYEFGVWRGEAFRHLIKYFKIGYGFDTFTGLPEDWHEELAGSYSSDGNIPKIEGAEFVVGTFENTLPIFFSKKRPLASIINFDADLYSSTICALSNAREIIDSKTILIFDEFLINKNWEQDEFRALEEFCHQNNFTYDVIGVSFITKQVAVKLTNILNR